MSQRRLPPPDPPACLLRLRPSSQKGGTLIAEAVTERAEHERRVCDPDGYRPAFCANCNGTVLHVHDYRFAARQDWPGGVRQKWSALRSAIAALSGDTCVCDRRE